MTSRKKKYFWIAGSVGALLTLLFILLLLLPRLISLEPLRDKILADISQTLGGTVEFEKVALSFFPRPYVVIHGASLSVSGKASGTLESLRFYPKMLPLLMAKLSIARLEVKSPDFRIRLPDEPEKEDQGQDRFSIEKVKEKLASSLSLASLRAPGLVMVLIDGRLDLLREDKSAFLFQDIRARIVLPPGKLEVNLTCESSLWDDMSCEGWMDVGDFQTNGLIDLTHFRPHLLSVDFLSSETVRVGESELNLDLEFQTEGPKVLQGKVQGAIPYLTLYRGKEKVVIKGKGLKGAFRVDENQTTVSLAELNLDDPQLNMSGKLSVSRISPKIGLELEGREVGVDSVRESVLTLAGDYPVTRKIFDIVKSGTVPFIGFDTHGSSRRDLGRLENITIKGNMSEGKIFVPGIGLDLDEVRGEVVISEGMLQGKNLEARLGNSQGGEGTLKLGLLGLRKGTVPFHLDILLDADLRQLPPILKQVTKDKSFRKQIDLIDDFHGNAKGRLILGERLDAITTRVNVSQFNLRAKYQPVPYPLEIGSGQFHYDGKRIDVKHLTGKLGRSSFSGFSSGLDWTRKPYLEILSGKSTILLDEIYPWLSSSEGVKQGWLIDLETVKGTVLLSATSLTGPLQKPKRWRFKTEGEVRDLSLHTALFSRPITVTRGRFRATPDRLTIMDAQSGVLDASLNLSGSAEGYQEGVHKIEMSFSGTMGQEATAWVSEKVHLPQMLYIRPPFSMSHGYLTWNKEGRTSVSGNLALSGGTKVSMNVMQDRDGLTVRDMLVKDEESNASMAFNFKDKEFALSFAGHLSKETLDRCLVDNEYLYGWINGDLQARVFTDQPKRFTADGTLKAENIVLPKILSVPTRTDSMSLNAEGNSLTVQSAVVTLGDDRITLKGDMKAAADGLRFDMELFSDEIKWDTAREILGEYRKETAPEEAVDSWDLPVRGVLRVKSKSFVYERFTWSPFQADISFDRDSVSMNVGPASLCGIATPGLIGLAPQKVQLDFNLVSKKQELDSALACLANKPHLMIGKFDFDGNVTAEAGYEDVVKSLKGNLKLDTDGGRIYRFGLLAKIFALLNVNEMFSGRLPDLTKEGFEYNYGTARAELRGGKLALKELVIDSPSMEMACLGDIDLVDKKLDLKVLVAPLKTVDSIVKKIPLVSDVLGGTLVSIPIKVTGDLGDPTVTPLSPSAVGSGLVGIMKRTLELPFKIIEPLAPSGQ